jgi:hypothetical protein
VAVLHPISEQDFLGFSYGFRPGGAAAVMVEALARARSGSAALAAECPAKALQLLRRARQRRGAVRLSATGGATVAAIAIATQRARLRDLRADAPRRSSLAAAAPQLRPCPEARFAATSRGRSPGS